MVNRFGESFDALAMAAEASKSTYEDQARTITTLPTTNAELTGQVKKLTNNVVTLSERLAALTKQRYDNAPPGFGNDKADTGSAANSAGVFMPTTKKYGKVWFRQQAAVRTLRQSSDPLAGVLPREPQTQSTQRDRGGPGKGQGSRKGVTVRNSGRFQRNK